MEDLLEISTNTFIGLNKIREEDVPYLTKQIEKSKQHLQKSQDNIEAINESLKEARELDKKLDDKIKRIDADTRKVLSIISEAHEKLIKTIKEAEKTVKGFEQLEKIIDKIDEIETRLDEQQEAIEEIEDDIETQNDEIKKVKERPIVTPTEVKVVTTPKNQSVVYQFPDSLHFNMGSVKTVKKTRPDGIVIEGTVLKMKAWTEMLENVIAYCNKNYDIDFKDLCNMKYGDTVYEDYFITYFIYGRTNDTKYRYIKGCNISAYYSGSDYVVDVLRCLLCDYLEIDEKDVEIYYHIK